MIKKTSKKSSAAKSTKTSKLPAASLQVTKKKDEPVTGAAQVDLTHVERPHGKIILPASAAPKPSEPVEKEDSFLQKTGKAESASTPVTKKKSLLGKMFSKKDEEKEEASADQEKETGPKAVGALQEFADHADHVVKPAPVAQKKPTLEPTKPTKKEEKAQKLAKDEKEIKEEMRKHEKDVSEDVAPKKESMIKKNEMYKKSSEFKRLIASIGHIGLGKERMRFVENLATMLNAGLPLVDSLKTLLLETRVKSMKKLLQRILDSVENGSPLWRAMEKENFFSLQALALVRIGEESGNLAENIQYLANQEQKDHELRSKVKMAMIYPSIVLTIMFIIVIGLGMFVLPNLIGVLYSLNVELPFVTRMVILFSNTFTQYGAIIVPGMIGGGLLLVILAKFTPLRRVTQWFLFRIPGIGRLAREATIARFGVILGGLLKAGVPVIEAMESLVEVTPIVAYKNLYAKMKERVALGDSFSKSFASIKGSQKLLPPSVQQLVITGEKSGALADIMLKVADIYDKKASETAQKLPVILEPMLLLFIGGLVGTIAFAIIVPIYSIVGTVGR